MDLASKTLHAKERERGAVLVLVVFVGLVLLGFTAVSLTTTKAHSSSQRVQRQVFAAETLMDSGISQALARVRDLGQTEPHSGFGSVPIWVPFGNGAFFYRTTHVASEKTHTIRAWGRIPITDTPSSSTVAPDDGSWDDTGWMVRGVEITLLSEKHIPTSALYFGNGGVQLPMGGFQWDSSVDPADPDTWVGVTSNPDSWQSNWVPFEVNALNHPTDTLYGGTAPDPALAVYHPYNIWTSQNPIGQFNIDAWFANSAGTSSDPRSNVTPDPGSGYFDEGTDESPNHPFPVEPTIPDVQDFAWSMWNTHSGEADAVLLDQGSHAGEYGDNTDPKVVFVTGALTVDAGDTFKGAGVLVIRDDFDPNTQTNNTPDVRAKLYNHGTFEWTGLVIVAGWTPTIQAFPGSDTTIVGSIFGEDSVQSGGEISLDSATIALRVEDNFRVLYSNGMFIEGGLVHHYLPDVIRRVVGVKAL